MERDGNKPLLGQTVLITGAARRLGRVMALAVASAGGNVVIHYNQSKKEAEDLQNLIQELGSISWLVAADLSDFNGIQQLNDEAFSLTPINVLINNASIFQNFSFPDTTYKIWQDHMQVNLTVPFLLAQSFARNIHPGSFGRIVNMLDWRALRPGKDHFAYSISKAGLASMTQSLALELAPQIAVNAIALGAILPPENDNLDDSILEKVPLNKWANPADLEQLLLYLLTISPALTGQIIHLDGGRQIIH